MVHLLRTLLLGLDHLHPRIHRFHPLEHVKLFHRIYQFDSVCCAVYWPQSDCQTAIRQTCWGGYWFRQKGDWRASVWWACADDYPGQVLGLDVVRWFLRSKALSLALYLCVFFLCISGFLAIFMTINQFYNILIISRRLGATLWWSPQSVFPGVRWFRLQ